MEIWDDKMMDQICKVIIHWKKSPLCNNWDLYHKAKKITENAWADWKIVIGITYAESHIGSNYAGTCNSSWNNWGWVKARVAGNGKVSRDQAIPNKWCWLYKFKNMEDYFVSKANIIWVNYKWCMLMKTQYEKVKCISYNYVWLPNVPEQSWINNVFKLYSL